MPVRKMLIFHIGDPKTGSSSIQRTLFDGSWSSTVGSLAYPERLTQIALAKSLYDGAPARQRKQHFAVTADWLSRQQAEVAVLSAEHFAFVQPHVLQNAVQEYLPDYAEHVRVVAYVRPHLSRLLSTYAQRVKTRGLQQDFETFCRISVREQRFFYTPRFLAWRETFGKSFTLRPFIREQLYRQNVVTDFLQQALGSSTFAMGEEAQANESPSLDHLACLQLVQKVMRNAGMDQRLRHALCRTLAQKLYRSAPEAGGRLKIPAGVVPFLQESYRQDARDLDAAFFTGQPFSQALDQAAAGAISTPQTIAAGERFTSQQRKKLRRTARELTAVAQQFSGEWLKHLRDSKRCKQSGTMPLSLPVQKIHRLLDKISSTPTASAPSRLIFHIGDHKTGSTAIQYAFARGTVRLNSGGAFYPGQLAHNYLRSHMKVLAQGSDDKQLGAEEALHKLARKIRKAGAGCSLISAEALETVEPQVLRQAVDRFFTRSADEIRVTAYVRPHLSRLLSSYTERTKIGLTSESLEDYASRMLDTGKFRYHPRFSAWRAAFGEAFVLRPFLRDQLHKGDVVADLLHHGFGEEEFEITGQTPANNSLSLQDLMRLKLLQGHLQQHAQALRHALGWEFARLIGTLPSPAAPMKLQLHRKLAQRLHDAYLEDAIAMDHDFFGGDSLLETELNQALKAAVASPQKLDPAAHLEAEEIRSLNLMAQMVSGVLENSSVNWVQHFRLKRIAALKGGAP